MLFYFTFYNDGGVAGGGGVIPIPIPTNITTIIKALIFIIIKIQQQNYQWVAATTGHRSVTLLLFGVIPYRVIPYRVIPYPPRVY